LFSNYVFMQCGLEDRIRALQTNRVSQTLEVVDGAGLVHDLRQIRRLIELGIPLSIEARLQAGARVRVRRGPLGGMTGVVLKRQGESHLFVAVNFLQQGASIRLMDWEVEPIE
jgi:transcriptional antiterminator RfaH